MLSVAIDVSDRSIKYIELARSKKGLHVVRADRLPVPEGVIRSGIIEQPEAMKDLFRTLRESTSRAPFARVSLPEEQAYVFELVVTTSDTEEVRSMIELQLEKYVPIPLYDAVFDFEVLAETKDGFIVIVSVMDRATIEVYQSVCESAGIIPIVFELESYALSRAVAGVHSEIPVLIVDCGDARTGVSVAYRGHLLYTTTLDVGGGSLTQLIKKALNCTNEEANYQKITHGIFDEYNSPELFASLTQSAKSIADEILRQKMYWNERSQKDDSIGGSIQKIVLCGGNAATRGFVEYVASHTGEEVELADMGASIGAYGYAIDFGNIPKNDTLAFSTAIGLALGDFIV